MIISVVIPVYNAESSIVNTLDSIREQCVGDDILFDVVLVNDGSTDSSLNVINDYINQYVEFPIRLYSKANGGVSSARNFGIKKAVGEWVAFLDSDDVWLKDKTRLQVEVIRNTPNINFIGCARNNESLSLYGREISYLYQATPNDLLFKMFPQTSTAIIKRSVIVKVGYYDEKMTHAEDGDLWVRVCNQGGFYYMPESLVITGSGKKNYGDTGLSANLQKMHYGTLQMLKKCYDTGIIASGVSYHLFRFFYTIKYWKRIVNVWMRK